MALSGRMASLIRLEADRTAVHSEANTSESGPGRISTNVIITMHNAVSFTALL